jgi:putative ABC transport system substrate-binding protein
MQAGTMFDAVHMRRRDVIKALGATGAASSVSWPLRVRAQQPMPVIGILHGGAADAFSKQIAVLRQGLRDGGYIEGQNVAIEFRWADSRADLLPKLADDLVQRRVAVIVALGGNAPALAAKAATTTIPIVFNTGADPVRAGLVTSLNRPGGNVTGVSFLVEQLGSKMLGLLRELAPNATTFGLLINPKNPNASRQIADTQAAAQALRTQLQIVNAAQPGDLDKAFASLAERRVGGLVLGADPLFAGVGARIIELAAKHRIPTAYYRREYAEAGGLMSYGTSANESYSQVGAYVARILKGAKPHDLPVFQVVKFEFILNLKTAKALDLDVPPGLSARADEVIE